MRSYPVKENHIGSAVSEILRYRQIDRKTSCYFIIKKIYIIGLNFVTLDGNKIGSKGDMNGGYINPNNMLRKYYKFK